MIEYGKIKRKKDEKRKTEKDTEGERGREIHRMAERERKIKERIKFSWIWFLSLMAYQPL